VHRVMSDAQVNAAAGCLAHRAMLLCLDELRLTAWTECRIQFQSHGHTRLDEELVRELGLKRLIQLLQEERGESE